MIVHRCKCAHQLLSYSTLYPHNVWNVHDATISGTARRNNFSEGWMNSFRQLVGLGHPAVLPLIEALQMNQSIVANALTLNARRQPPEKRVHKAKNNDPKTLSALCINRRDGKSSITDTLSGAAHHICFAKWMVWLSIISITLVLQNNANGSSFVIITFI